MDELIEQPVAPTPVPSGGDLSREIERFVTREPSDRVRCVRLYNDCYRCNWWAPVGSGGDVRGPMADWAATAMHRVRKSQFLRATARAGKLVIEETGRDE